MEEVDDEISSSDVTDVAVDVMHDDMPKPLVIVDEDEPEIEIITIKHWLISTVKLVYNDHHRDPNKSLFRGGRCLKEVTDADLSREGLDVLEVVVSDFSLTACILKLKKPTVNLYFVVKIKFVRKKTRFKSLTNFVFSTKMCVFNRV